MNIRELIATPLFKCVPINEREDAERYAQSQRWKRPTTIAGLERSVRRRGFTKRGAKA